MARIRTIKPEFFVDEDLQDLEIANPGAYCMMVFAGLWGHCSRDGVFEYRPRTLKLSILPFLPFEMADTLNLLVGSGFIQRFCVDDREYGYISTFVDHQRISGKEALASPKHPQYIQGDKRGSTGEAPGKYPGAQEREKEKEREKDSSSTTTLLPEVVTPPTPVADPEPSSSLVSINEFRVLFQEATGQMLPGGCNKLASELCRRYDRQKIKGAFEITAMQGGKTLKYVTSVLEDRPKPEARSRDSPSRHEAAVQRGRENLAAAMEAIYAAEGV